MAGISFTFPSFPSFPHTGRSAARLARLLREQEVPGSNPGAPITIKAPLSASIAGLCVPFGRALRSLASSSRRPDIVAGISPTC